MCIENLGGNPIVNNPGIVSNQNGVIDISNFHHNDTLKISHVSYQTKKITKKNISAIIYLAPKINILPAINLTKVIKTQISPTENIIK